MYGVALLILLVALAVNSNPVPDDAGFGGSSNLNGLKGEDGERPAHFGEPVTYYSGVVTYDSDTGKEQHLHGSNEGMQQTIEEDTVY